MPRSADKTTTPSGGRQYGGPPSKYDPTRQMYDPTYNGMGPTMAAFTFEAN